MKLLLCWVTVRACLCFRPLHASVRQKVVSFHVANKTSMADSGPVFRTESKVKCTLICFERTSCTSVFFSKSEGKCRPNNKPQEPAYNSGPDNSTREDAKVRKQDPKSEVTKKDPERKIYYGVLRNTLTLGDEDSGKMSTEPPDENSQAITRYKSEQYVYFKEIGLSLIHHLDKQSWRMARHICKRKRDVLFVIDNQAKQDAAKRLVEFSGEEEIFIGIYKHLSTWRYCGSDEKASYTNWAPREPQYRFGAMSRSSDYKWVTKSKFAWTSCICAKRVR